MYSSSFGGFRNGVGGATGEAGRAAGERSGGVMAGGLLPGRSMSIREVGGMMMIDAI
jgi:hypothetical protein